jgi:hypothetical protein
MANVLIYTELACAAACTLSVRAMAVTWLRR